MSTGRSTPSRRRPRGFARGASAPRRRGAPVATAPTTRSVRTPRRGTSMNRHAGPPRGGEPPSVPEPTYAERARTLAYLGRTGALATLSRKYPGHPFASVMPYAPDELGQPLVLI